MTTWTIRLDGSTLPDKQEIGGKGWSVARMAALGLPVPPAFVITTRACVDYQRTGSFPDGLLDEVAEGMRWLEAETGRSYGAGPKPLLVSVRSGAPISMPGMMDTILNLGICEETHGPLAEEFGNQAFARDTHRRFLELYAGIVLKTETGPLDHDARPADWIARIEAGCGQSLPRGPVDRLHSAIRAVFDSWNSRRARRYRQHHGISDGMGTAVVVQAMVFGNLNDISGTGVMFSRNPIDGSRVPYGEFLARAQGEDVVSGKFTPRPLDTMRDLLPEAHGALLKAAEQLERAGADVQDIEFTVQDGKLYLLQSRSAKRAPLAALNIAADLLAEGVIDARAALNMISPAQVRALLAPHLSETVAAGATALVTGVPASPGIGIGQVVVDTAEAERRGEAGEAVILARATTSPDDLHGMIVSRAVVTEQGGATSHAAVVGRALNVPCVVGCGTGSLRDLAGRLVTVDGSTGTIYDGALEIEQPDEDSVACVTRLTMLAEELSPVKVLAPEDAPADVLDLSSLPGGDDPAQLSGLLADAGIARGGALATSEGMAVAIAAGLHTVVGTPRLALLLAAIQSAPPAE